MWLEWGFIEGRLEKGGGAGLGSLECQVEGTGSFSVSCRKLLKFEAVSAQNTALPLGLAKVERTKVALGIRQSGFNLDLPHRFAMLSWSRSLRSPNKENTYVHFRGF